MGSKELDTTKRLHYTINIFLISHFFPWLFVSFSIVFFGINCEGCTLSCWRKRFYPVSSTRVGLAALQGVFRPECCRFTCVCCCLFQSSLLRALLGELPPSQGKVNVHGRIAYVSQQPWVFPGTVRSNILFGKKYEEERYKEVIKACALEEVSNDLWAAYTQISNDSVGLSYEVCWKFFFKKNLKGLWLLL